MRSAPVAAWKLCRIHARIFPGPSECADLGRSRTDPCMAAVQRHGDPDGIVVTRLNSA